MAGRNSDAEIGRDGEAEVQSCTALLVKAPCETLLTLRQNSLLALAVQINWSYCGAVNVWQRALVFNCTGTAPNVRKTTASYPDGLTWMLFSLVFFVPSSSCLPIQGNAVSWMCGVSRWSYPVGETPGLFVGGEPSLLRTSGGGLTAAQRNVERQETTILFEPEKGWISVLKHLI